MIASLETKEKLIFAKEIQRTSAVMGRRRIKGKEIRGENIYDDEVVERIPSDTGILYS